jgi:hypothetical protein
MQFTTRTEATMDTTLISTTKLSRAARPDTLKLLRSAVTVLDRIRTAIVNGPSDGCWRPVDATTSFSMLPTRERARLLDRGFTSTAR